MSVCLYSTVTCNSKVYERMYFDVIIKMSIKEGAIILISVINFNKSPAMLILTISTRIESYWSVSKLSLIETFC